MCSSEDLSKQLAAGMDLAEFSPDELIAAHDEAHDLYAMAIRGTDAAGLATEELVGIHARVVGELVARGMPHPRPPADMLDGTTSPRPGDAVQSAYSPPNRARRKEGEGEDVEKYDVAITVPLIKVDNEKRLVTGVVLEPDEVDAHGDFEKVDTIQRAAHKFLAEFNRRTKLGIQHSIFGEIGVDLVESFIAPVDMTFGAEVVKAGSWVMVVKILDDLLWQSIKAGAITGFSIGGVATVAGTA